MRLEGLKGNHNTFLPSQSSKFEDSRLNGMENINAQETGFNDWKETSSEAPRLLVWSSADEKGISRLQRAWKSHFSTATKSDDSDPKFLSNLAYTLACRRTHLPWKAFVVARPSDSLGTLMDKISPASQSRISPNIAMVFSGVSPTSLYNIKVY